MSPATHDPLVDLPGSSADPGLGVVVLELTETLFDDAGGPGAHRDHLTAWYRDTVASMVVRAEDVESAVAGIEPRSHALPTLLISADRQGLRAARDLLAQDDRVELVGVRLPLEEATGAAAEHLLAALDFTVPAWIELAPVPGWREVLAVLVADGAENLTLMLDGSPADQAADLVRALVDADLTVRLGGDDVPVVTRSGPRVRYGMLNALCALRAALNGAEAEALGAILAETEAAPLTSALRRMSEADAAVTRSFLAGVEVRDLAATVHEWVALGLMAEA